MRELFPMIVSIVLFFITLIIIFVLRKADQKDRSLNLVKRYVAQHTERLHRSGDEMKTIISEVESRFYKAENDAQVVITQITEQKRELFSHLEDLQELQGTIVQYHKVLTNLSEMTTEVENKTQKVKAEMEKVGEIEQLIHNFNNSLSDTQEEIDSAHQQLHQSMSVYQTKIEQSIEFSLESLRDSFESEKQQFLATLEIPFQQMRETSISLLKELQEQLVTVEQSAEALSNSHVISLEEIKKKCEEQLREVEKQTTQLHLVEGKLSLLQQTISSLEKEQEIKEGAVISAQEEIETLEKEKENLADEIEEALRIQEQLKKEEELSSLIEREKVDFPDMDENEDDFYSFQDDEEEEVSESSLSHEQFPVNEESSDLHSAPSDEEEPENLEKRKKGEMVDHQKEIDEIEEGEEEINLEEDEIDV